MTKRIYTLHVYLCITLFDTKHLKIQGPFITNILSIPKKSMKFMFNNNDKLQKES